MKECVYDVAVLGAGASGLMASIFCAKNNKKVVLVEKNEKLGKKLLVTGNGRCNLANVNISKEKYNTDMVQEIFNEISPESLVSIFAEMGIEIYSDSEGRCYPLSDSASSVVDAFTQKILSMPIDLKTGSEIVSCEKVSDIFETTLTCGEIIKSKKVIVATGGETTRKILKNMQEKFNEPKKVLVGYKCKNFDKSLAGLRVDADVSVNIGEKKFSEKGQVQFREDGVSGIVIFNASVFVANNGQLPVKIKLNLMPKLDKIEFFNKLKTRQKINSYLLVKDFLVSYFHYKLSAYILKRAGIKNLEKPCLELSENELKNICDIVYNMEFELVETSGNAQVNISGIDEKHLDKLEVKTCKGMFVCGESTGVYGYCGGYNLAWAFLSGVYCGKRV